MCLGRFVCNDTKTRLLNKLINNCMKKTFLVAACALSMLASAQILEIVSTQKIATPKGTEWKVAGFSPVGDYLLLTDDGNSGLVRYELASKQLETISEAMGAGWAVQISKDGQNNSHALFIIDIDNQFIIHINVHIIDQE